MCVCYLIKNKRHSVDLPDESINIAAIIIFSLSLIIKQPEESVKLRPNLRAKKPLTICEYILARSWLIWMIMNLILFPKQN